MIVYLITNKINGNQYIGQTVRTLSRRWWSHVNDAKSNKWDYPFHRAIRKYGEENFSLEIIGKYSTLKDLNNAEEYFIEYYNCMAPEGYNLHSGGNNHTVSEYSKQKMSNNRKGSKHKLTTIEKISKSQKGRIFSQETIEKMSKAHTGKKLTEEHKNNIRKVNMGKVLSKEHIENIKKSHIGKKFTQEHCDNMSKSRSCKILSSEKRSAISKGHVGIRHAEETKKKLSLLNKGKKPNIGKIKPIFCHETKEIYKSFGQAAKKLNICRPGIQRCLKSGVPYHGYTFSYAQEEKNK